jgi:hypothetical protein
MANNQNQDKSNQGSQNIDQDNQAPLSGDGDTGFQRKRERDQQSDDNDMMGT